METSNIFKLNAMVTYNQGNYFNQVSMTNYLERKEIKTKENGELPHLHFQDRGIYVFFQPIIYLEMLSCIPDIIYLYLHNLQSS